MLRPEPNQKRKSYSSENTFRTDITMEEVAAYVRTEAETLFTALTEKKLLGRTITVKLRTGDFKTATRRHTLDGPLDAYWQPCGHSTNRETSNVWIIPSPFK